MPATSTSTTVPGLAGAGLAGFETIPITLNDRELTVALADTPARRQQGLMGVTDLGGLQGMLFSFDAPDVTAFWMKNTLIPLDIAFFDEDGVLLEVLAMEPCTADPCPTYGLDEPSLWALEAPRGDLQDLPASAKLAGDDL